MTPHILAHASLPALCSFSSDEPPELKVSLTLKAQSAIATYKQYLPCWPVVNALRITDTQTFEAIRLPRMDVCFRRSATRADGAPIPTMIRGEELLILEPDVPYVLKLDFRPFGNEIFDAERVRRMGSEKWRVGTTLGMHLLEVGKEYALEMQEGLELKTWVYGTKQLLMAVDEGAKGLEEAGGGRSRSIPVEVGKAERFRIET